MYFNPLKFIISRNGKVKNKNLKRTFEVSIKMLCRKCE